MVIILIFILVMMKNNDLNIDNNESFWWNGVHPYSRKKYKYIGCIIGINFKLYNENKDIFEIWNYDEGFVEEYILNLSNIDFFISKNVFSWNIKTKSNNEISSFKSLKNHYINSSLILNYNEIPHKNKIENEFNYVVELSKLE